MMSTLAGSENRGLLQGGARDFFADGGPVVELRELRSRGRDAASTRRANGRSVPSRADMGRPNLSSSGVIETRPSS